jgi:hypothetical protein
MPGLQRPDLFSRGHGPLMCRFCASELRIPEAYGRLMWLLVLGIVSVLGLPTYIREHAGTWLLVLLLLAIPIRLGLSLVLPPWFEPGKQRSFNFVSWYIVMALTMPLSIIVLGRVHVPVGTKGDVANFAVTFSIPLAWISSDFRWTGRR